MSIEHLIQDYKNLEMRLKQAICGECTDDQIRNLDSKLVEAFNSIREYEPRSSREIQTKLGFLAVRIDQVSTENRYLIDALVETISQSFGGQDLEPVPSPNKGQCPYENLNMLDLIAGSNDRVSIIDLGYRYVNTSESNGAFYDQNPDNIIGCHVGEIIGEARFEQRARYYLDKAFSGEKQQYFHSLNINSETRIMSCEMTPLLGKEQNTLGAMVSMNDVTGKIISLNSIALEELRVA